MAAPSPATQTTTIILQKGDPVINGSIKVESLDQTSFPTPLSDVTIKITDPNLFQPLHLAAYIPLSVSATVTVECLVPLPNIATAWIVAGLTPQSEATTPDGRRRYSASKLPSAVQAVALPKRNLAKDVVHEDNELVDEDDLLNSEGDWAPSTTAATKTDDDDCGGREPCENCTCGRKDGATTGGGASKPLATSNCGKCGMGDAFRCASCPYLGKPAFQPGQEHLVLDLQDDF